MDMNSETLELRLTHLETELRKANARVRALEGWRRRSVRSCVLTFAGVAVLLLVFGLVVPTPGAAPGHYEIPFWVESDGKPLLSIHENSKGTGPVMSFWNTGKAEVLTLGVDTVGNGVITVHTPDGQQKAMLSINDTGSPALELSSGGKTVADLAIGTDNETRLRIWNTRAGSQVVSLGTYHQNGYLLLANRSGNPMVEAGVTKLDVGSVRAYGPTGKCNLASGMIGIAPCLIAGR